MQNKKKVGGKELHTELCPFSFQTPFIKILSKFLNNLRLR